MGEARGDGETERRRVEGGEQMQGEGRRGEEEACLNASLLGAICQALV